MSAHSEWSRESRIRRNAGIYGVTVSILIFIFISSMFMPLFENDAKWDFVIPVGVGISILASPVIFRVEKWQNVTFKIFLILLSWYLLVFIHRGFFPPGTEYAANKFPYLIFISFLAGFAMPAAIENSKGWRLGIIALICVGVLFSIISFFPSTESSNARYSAIGLSPTQLAKLTAVPLIAAICYRRESARIRWILFVTAILAVAGCINTGSRTPLIAVCIAYATYLFVRFRIEEVVKSTGIYLVFAFVFLIYLGFANPEVVQRFSFDSLSVANNSDEGDRIYLYQIAIEIIRSNPLGIGLGNFSTVFWINAPHNIYLEAIAEIGWIGVVPLLLLTWIGLKNSWKLFRTDDSTAHFFAIFFVYNLITGLVGNELTLPSLMFYLSIGLSAAYAQILSGSEGALRTSTWRHSGLTSPALRS